MLWNKHHQPGSIRSWKLLKARLFLFRERLKGGTMHFTSSHLMTASVCGCAANCERRLPPLSSLHQPPPHADGASVAALMWRFPRTPDQYSIPAIHSQSSFHMEQLGVCGALRWHPQLHPLLSTRACLLMCLELVSGRTDRARLCPPCAGWSHRRWSAGWKQATCHGLCLSPGSSNQTVVFSAGAADLLCIETLQEML